MRPRGPAGATSIAAALGRLDRLAHVPAGLSGTGPLGDLTAQPLAGLALEGSEVVGAAALEHALAPVESPSGGAPAAEGDVSVRGPGVPATRRDVAVPGRVGAQMSRAAPARRPEAGVERPRSRVASAVAAGASASLEGTAAHLPPGSDDTAGPASPAPVQGLSRSARLGASTPVGLPAPARGGGSPEAAAGSTPQSAGMFESAAEATSGPWAGPSAAAGPPSAALVPAATAAPRAHTHHEHEQGSAGVDRDGPTRSATTSALRLGNGPAPTAVEGFSGLVSWWNAHEATQPPAGPVGGVPAGTRRVVAWSAAPDGAREAPRTTEDVVEGSPVVRLSFRSALEELLLAEARASGIEVYP